MPQRLRRRIQYDDKTNNPIRNKLMGTEENRNQEAVMNGGETVEIAKVYRL